MRSLSVSVFAVAALLCATPLSLHWSHGTDMALSDMSLSAGLDTASAADLGVPVRHHRRHYAGYYGRLYDPYCNGPYTGGVAGMAAPITAARGSTFVAMAACTKQALQKPAISHLAM